VDNINLGFLLPKKEKKIDSVDTQLLLIWILRSRTRQGEMDKVELESIGGE
jgi:hypothetical protein